MKTNAIKIALAADHGGYKLKEEVKKVLEQQGYEILDYGCNSLKSVDYPDYIQKAAWAVAQNRAQFGIVFCGSGVGASIVANKVPKIRAVLGYNEYVVEYSRRHNNTNILALGGRLITPDLALRFVSLWLHTSFEGERHNLRLEKITQLEKSCQEQNL